MGMWCSALYYSLLCTWPCTKSGVLRLCYSRRYLHIGCWGSKSTLFDPASIFHGLFLRLCYVTTILTAGIWQGIYFRGAGSDCSCPLPCEEGGNRKCQRSDCLVALITFLCTPYAKHFSWINASLFVVCVFGNPIVTCSIMGVRTVQPACANSRTVDIAFFCFPYLFWVDLRSF